MFIIKGDSAFIPDKWAKIGAVPFFLLLHLLAATGIAAEHMSPMVAVQSTQPFYAIDSDRVHIILVIQNTTAESINPHKIFYGSAIMINDRSFPIYATWRRAEESVIQPGETFTQRLDLKFYFPFQEIGEYIVRWKNKDITSAPATITIRGKEEAPPFPPTVAASDVEPPAREIDKVYYEDGVAVFSETDLFSDRNNGFYSTFYRNGRLKSEVRYKNGWEIYDKAFDERGRPVIRNGPVKNYYGGGNVLSDIVHYKNDKKHGVGTYYYYDGKTVVDVWHYFDGVQAGIHTRNDQFGNLRYREDWGYPTQYVQHLRRIIALLSFCLVLLAAGLFALIGYYLKSSFKR